MKNLTEKDYKDAAQMLNCEVAAIKAVAEVEASGDGFLDDGSPKILFEGHFFWRELKAKKIDPSMHRRGNEDILYPTWERHYKGGKAEYSRLEKATKIDEEAALRSASWGTFQILGKWAEDLGYDDVFDFVYSIRSGARENLMAFVAFVKFHKLDDNLRDLDWEGFAKGYNGSDYKENKYDAKMAAAYKKYKG